MVNKLTLPAKENAVQLKINEVIDNIPDEQVQSNWNETDTSSKAYIQNKPTIPTVGNGTITITQGGVQKGTFTTNQSGNTTIDLDSGGSDIEVDDELSTTSENPVQNKIITNALENKANKSDLSTVATTGDYDDLSNKPTIPAEQVNSDWNATSGKAQILNKPNFSTVATSGSYNDLADKPTIPSDVTESTVSDWGFTKNTGTVTSVNNVSPVNGNVSLTIPAVGDGTITITQGGVKKGTFTTNQSGNSTIDLDAGSSTDVQVNGTSITSNGVANMQTTTNLVTSLSASSTDTQYPSAKCVYDIVGNIETLLSEV